VTLCHNVDSPQRVRDTVEAMTATGAEVVKAPQVGDRGGIFHAHVRDPNGIVWEIAHNPRRRIDERGDVHFG